VISLKSIKINGSISLVIVFLLFISITQVKAQTTTPFSYYQIQPGDTLGSVADFFGVSIEDIALANNIADVNIISPGQIIVIPGLEISGGTLVPQTIDSNTTLEEIKQLCGCDFQQIIKLNNLTSLDEGYIGRKIVSPIPDNIEFSSAPIAVNLSLLETAVYLELSPEFITEKNTSIILPGNHIQIPINTDLSFYKKRIDYIELNISPLPFKQGSTVVIRLKTTSPHLVAGTLGGNSLHFFEDKGNSYVSLQGINALENPGVMQLLLTLKDENGNSQSIKNIILIESGNFSTDPSIIVDPVTIDPKATVPENEFISGIVSKFSPIQMWSGKFESPAFYQEYTSLFGNRRTYNNNPEVTFHGGVDFGGGETLPIVAPANGKVVFSGFLTIRGNATIIDHGLGVFSAYFHQSKTFVSEGDEVVKGQKIGEVGNTGRVGNANDYPGAGAHLHWEIWVNGNQVDPLDWLDFEYP
jgi:murein DD-endopeptidase MepM/ murein hydrolase activator NlpD